MNLCDAQILVTGGGRGIGRHMVERLASEGCRVAVFERDGSAQAALAAALPQVRCYLCDVTEPCSIRNSLAAMESDGFETDVLVNNAGLIHSEPLVNMLAKEHRIHSLDTWKQTIAANLDSVFYVTGEVVNRMLARRKKGVIISVSSISAKGNAGQSAYSAAKAGVNALTRTWAKELGAFGIRFAAIAPGFLDTPSTRQSLSETIITRLKQQIPLRRMGEVEHIYQAVRFIIENDYVNGTVLEIDGGLVI